MHINKLITILTMCLIVTGIALLGGCGGGGGSAPPATLQLTIEAATVPTGTTLGTIQAVITIPAGVNIAASTTGEVQEWQITAAGTAATGSPRVNGSYNPDIRQLIVNVISPAAGFGNGACAVVTFDVASGATVIAADFTVTSVQARDYVSAAPVAGVSITLH